MNKSINPNKLKTVASYAAMNNKSVQTVYLWVKSGKVESVKIDGVLFIVLE